MDNEQELMAQFLASLTEEEKEGLDQDDLEVAFYNWLDIMETSLSRG